MSEDFHKLRQALGDIFDDSEITEIDEDRGFSIKPKDSRWTAYTVYLNYEGGFTLYEAIPDIWKGIDIEDEKLICRGSLDVIAKRLNILEG